MAVSGDFSKLSCFACCFFTMNRPFTLSDFDFDLPPDLIAQTPAAERTASRLLHVQGHHLDDLHFSDLPRLLLPGDLLVFNDTRVIKARLRGHKATGGKVEMLIERFLGPHDALVQIRASHPPPPGSIVHIGSGAQAVAVRIGERHERFFYAHLEADLWQVLDAHGEIPLPPYIHHRPDDSDADRYQTVFARTPGAVAAPTAGLHFDAPLLAQLDALGIETAFLTLHVGAGTFLPVHGDDIETHRMHSEWYSISDETVAAIDRTRKRGGRIVAVGTTATRALESAAASGTLRAGSGETSIFIRPGYRFAVVDRLITNFHLPRSTLMMLVSAFAGYEPLMAAYRHAVAARYRFFSYGDAMLLERKSA